MSDAQLQGVFDSQATEEKRALLSKRLKTGISEDEMNFAEARVAEVLDLMEERLQDRPWLCGENMMFS